MISRDKHGIVIQLPEDVNSRDDSLARTSILALCGSETDKQNLSYWFSMGAEPARYPDRFIRNYPPETSYYGANKGLSRDQLVPYVSALHSMGFGTEDENCPKCTMIEIWKRHGLFVNSDLLMPDLKWMFAKAAGHWSQYLWAIPGVPMTCISIAYSCMLTPKHELNQLFCQSFVAGKWATKLICKLHPDWRANLSDYWGLNPNGHGKWRMLPDVARMMIKRVEMEL